MSESGRYVLSGSEPYFNMLIVCDCLFSTVSFPRGSSLKFIEGSVKVTENQNLNFQDCKSHLNSNPTFSFSDENLALICWFCTYLLFQTRLYHFLILHCQTWIRLAICRPPARSIWYFQRQFDANVQILLKVPSMTCEHCLTSKGGHQTC